ncbi:MAG: S-methyl-5-thioribose-1-phosphate isomerase [Sphaerochaetaceae bacterium]
MEENFKTIDFFEDTLVLLDQRALPKRVTYVHCTTYKEVEFAIRDMIVRGAPAIGATAAYGVYLAAREFSSLHNQTDDEAFSAAMEDAASYLIKSRPTAVNLAWAVDLMLKEYKRLKEESIDTILSSLLNLADTIKREDIQTNRMMGRIGSALIPEKATILTHCNTGALATAGWGTALGVIKTAYEEGKDIFVYADETRPRLQGARLTAWELTQAGIPSALISDSVAATLIRDGKIDLVILGGDRVAANGDVCNKIGTFMLSVLCKVYGVPFYSAVPVSTIDFSIASGKDIPIELRASEEVTRIGSEQIAPDGMQVYNPAFDVTPNENVTGIITEKGILYPPYTSSIEEIRKTLQ